MTSFAEIFFLPGIFVGVFLFGMLWGWFIAAVNDPAHNHNCYDPDGTVSVEDYQQNQVMRGV